MKYPAVPRLFFLVALLAAVPPALAQMPEPARTSAYFELLGNGLLYTVNLDRKFTDKVSGRVGLEVFGAVAVPVMVNYLAGEGNHRLELGAGPLLVFAPADLGAEEDGDALDLNDDAEFGAVGTATFGYRYQPVNGGFLFRAGFTPLFSFGGGIPWFGVSFGYAF